MTKSPTLMSKVRSVKVEQISGSSFELDDVQRPRPRHRGKRDALAEIVEIGHRCVQGTFLHLLGVT